MHVVLLAGNGKAGYTGDGHPATEGELDSPFGVGFDSAGDLLVADSGNGRVRLVTG